MRPDDEVRAGFRQPLRLARLVPVRLRFLLCSPVHEDDAEIGGLLCLPHCLIECGRIPAPEYARQPFRSSPRLRVLVPLDLVRVQHGDRHRDVSLSQQHSPLFRVLCRIFGLRVLCAAFRHRRIRGLRILRSAFRAGHVCRFRFLRSAVRSADDRIVRGALRLRNIPAGPDVRHAGGVQRIQRIKEPLLLEIKDVIVRKRREIHARILQPLHGLRPRAEGVRLPRERLRRVRISEFVVRDEDVR